MSRERFTRRDFLKTAGTLAAAAVAGAMPSALFADERRLVRFPEKAELILLTSRPPQLETPLHYFRDLITPNDALFVRWHLHPVPTSVDLGEWRLSVGGNTEKELSLSMNDLMKFEKVSLTAVIQCSGNGRSFFEPAIPGGQWRHGAMGNVTWAGARLNDILQASGVRAGSVDVSFDGLDRPPLPAVPDFVKSLPLDKAVEEDIIVAYEMNGGPLTILNGFPARLVVPGWYATYWVKSLSKIQVLPNHFGEFWMKTAYRIPDTPCGCVLPGAGPKKTVPITRMNTRSLIIEPQQGAAMKLNRPVEIMGIAFSGGYSVREVLVSVDNGRMWKEAKLGQDKGRYSWIQWSLPWKPAKPGRFTLMSKATNSIGESQPLESLWNPSGYLLNRVEKTEVVVT